MVDESTVREEKEAKFPNAIVPEGIVRAIARTAAAPVWMSILGHRFEETLNRMLLALAMVVLFPSTM